MEAKVRAWGGGSPFSKRVDWKGSAGVSDVGQEPGVYDYGDKANG